ncbi:thioredoxin-disulfide reductase [Halalkalicoccus jeotgali]|uniref:Thioredoxin reductase n=1 Tax=Halalkalicoccus jeotgali (strain DSM 18796 / CECT 7217 / JCM 14584 / KCTC 4019 / B3) TaxID=795797 RepID=D8J3C7_HALJB|nr:thioredoxin-disulfide reductase [Halalkalicoccus jeotgali]ADJ15234.1 thioredoxin reductase [Halalkalicoccus jeotgali B3]ELY35189.1 thioredoxin reductase [Halalkalicoccus jeotgali B3]
MSDQPRVEIYTKNACPYCEKATDLFDAKGVEYELYNVSEDEELFEEMVERAEGRQTAPEVFIDDELIGGWDETSAFDETGELDEKLGIESEAEVEHRRLVVAGSGIAGLTAAIYAARSNNEPLVIEGTEPGGQLTLTTDVANYPGFPEGISGPELINNMKEQATQFGADVINGVIESVDDSGRPYEVRMKNGDVYTADAVIAASGASARTLGIPGEDEMMGYGVSTCATCDGAFFRGEEMVVVGGGDAAMEEANFLTKFAEKVYLIHRREEFRAEDYWVDRIEEQVEEGNVEILRNTEVTEIHGTPEDGVEEVSLVTHPEGHPMAKLDDPETESSELDVGAFFIAIGHTPNTEYLEGTGVEMDAEGYLQTRGEKGGGQTKTDVPGIFGAGDVVDYHYQQAVTAAGMGCKAAIDADEFLENEERGASTAAEPAVAQSDD